MDGHRLQVYRIYRALWPPAPSALHTWRVIVNTCQGGGACWQGSSSRAGAEGGLAVTSTPSFFPQGRQLEPGSVSPGPAAWAAPVTAAPTLGRAAVAWRPSGRGPPCSASAREAPVL